jgi:hypothetical protein
MKLNCDSGVKIEDNAFISSLTSLYSDTLLENEFLGLITTKVDLLVNAEH